MRCLPAPQRGTGLVEALTACTVFALALLGHSALSAQVNRHLQEARCRTEAMLIAQSLIGRMAATEPAALTLRYEAGGSGGGSGGVGGGGGNGGDAEFAQAVARLPGSGLPGNAPAIAITTGPRPGSHRVTVTIGWQLPGSASAHRHTTITTIGGA